MNGGMKGATTPQDGDYGHNDDGDDHDNDDDDHDYGLIMITMRMDVKFAFQVYTLMSQIAPSSWGHFVICLGLLSIIELF